MRNLFGPLLISATAIGGFGLAACATRAEESAAIVAPAQTEPGSITALRYSEAVALYNVRAIAEQGLRDGIVSPYRGNCLAKTDAQPFVEVFVRIFSREFSPIELQQLDEFFWTRAGQQYAGRAIHQGFGMPGPAPTLSLAEQRQLDALVGTGVGKKMMEWQITHGPGWGDLIAKLNEVTAKCTPQG
jgi:hypothetical protein